MHNFLPILVDVWRQACLQPTISELADAILEPLRRRLPLARIAILAVDYERRRFLLEGAAGGGARLQDPLASDWERCVAWCRAARIERGSATQLAGQLSGLLPQGWQGQTLAGGLVLDGRPLGALLLASAPPASFAAADEPLLAALCEPIAIALRNDEARRTLVRRREAAEADRRSLLARLGRQDISDSVIGATTGLKEVMRGVELVARADAPVLILGETGSGKEVVAREVHKRSARADGPFLRVNCGAIPPELADSELFGHERGSFTGAAGRRKGWFERADGGTLFLDEIAELSPAVQVRLLRILQDGSYERVGGQQTLRVDVRLVAATHRDLPAMVRTGAFRQDLWYRINVFPIRLPALRERPEDIPAMATQFAPRAAERLGLAPQVPKPRDIARLLTYPWPGNVRELAAVIERAAILGDGRVLAIEQAMGADVPAPLVAAGAAESAAAASDTLDAAAIRHIEQALSRCLGRIEGPFGAAQALCINPHTLRSRMRRLGIDWRRFRPA